MNEYDLMESIGEIDQKFVDQAKNPAPLKRRRQSVRWGLSAAFACTLIAAGIITASSLIKTSSDTQPEDSALIQPKKDETVMTEIAEPADTGTQSSDILLTEVTDSEGMTEAFMMPVIVYNGKMYIGNEWYYGEREEKLRQRIAVRLGNGSGDLNEYSSEEAYSNELASNFTDEIYTVAGYDPDFRIAGVMEYEDSDHPAWIVLLDYIDAPALKTGSDLFEDRLHLWEKTESIQYHLHSPQKYIDMDSGTAVEIGSEIWSEFADQVNHAEFFNINTTGESSLYESDHQAHLIVNLDDGSIVRLRLIEGGYVGYDAQPGYFVKIPGEAFNAVYTSCGGTISQ
ncbi:MAG: hypothetical protein Q4C20_14035 [Erysipelotrichaceae bacterium]|nr:hypothetical protein [Erysipelotrichaceae bacterium]